MPKQTGKTVVKATGTASASAAKGGKPYVKKAKKQADPMFPSQPRVFRIGNAIQHKRDLGRFVRWPRYVRLQRQKKILLERLKVPPTINQFITAKLEKNQSDELFKLLALYRPETDKQKAERIKALADAKVAGKAVEGSKPAPTLKMGLHHVTYLIEEKKAKLVLIAADTDPLELVMWMPALCRKMNVPYIIVRSKARLGALVHKKTASCLALTSVNKEDAGKLTKMTELAMAKFNDDVESRRTWGGGVVGLRTQRRIAKREALIAIEKAKKAKMQV